MILAVHFCLVLFVAGGLVVVPVGAKAGSKWVHHRRFRLWHLIAMATVAAETIVGMACPLTVWEDALRGVEREEGFVARLLSGIIYYDLPPWIFGAAYLAGAVLVLALWWLVAAGSLENRRQAASRSDGARRGFDR
ncbi:MAG: DUF2784 domain-containing protein [Deltaproteobacteria bacterium]|nr:DUF2784 domain-containing protein [Deltaproteobacteria bacterium]